MESLQSKVITEYQQWFDHIRSEISAKDWVLAQLLPTPEKGKVYAHLLYKNLNLENSLFWADSTKVKFATEEWALWKEKVANMELVQQSDFEECDMEWDADEIRILNWLYWAAVRVVVWYDEDENLPISTVISPLNCIPDPKNYRGSKMRFFWFRRRMSIDDIKADSSFDVNEVEKLWASIDIELQNRERAVNSANWNTHIVDQDWLVDVYDHWTIYNGKKYFTTWAANRTHLLRKIELEPLTEAEKINPFKIDFGITIYRRRPIYWKFMWASIADEVLDKDDMMSKLYTLMWVNVNIASNWADILFDSSLDIDVATLQDSTPGGRYIPFNWATLWGQAIASKVFQTPSTANVSQTTLAMIWELDKISQDTSWKPSQTFWNTAPGSQTKAEVQTLTQNANVQLSAIQGNYLKWDKNFWKVMFKSYMSNMLKGTKKYVSAFTDSKSESKFLERDDFIPEGKFLIDIESVKDSQAKKDKDAAKFGAIIGQILPNLWNKTLIAKALRKLTDLQDIKGLKGTDLQPLTLDENKAYRKLELLNNNLDIAEPSAGEDYQTYIDIFKTGVETDAREKALENYEYALENKPAEVEQEGQIDPTASAMAWGQINSQLSQWNSAAPSIQDIQQ